MKRKIYSIFLFCLLFSSILTSQLSLDPQISFAEEQTNVHHALTEYQLSKFDAQFYDMILERLDNSFLSNNTDTMGHAYHNVLFILNKTDPQHLVDPETMLQQNKNDLANILLTQFNATDIYKAETLSFIIAKIPIEHLPTISTYDIITNIGDADEFNVVPVIPINNIPHGDTKTIIGWDENDRENYLLYTGLGSSIAILDNGVDITIPQFLPNLTNVYCYPANVPCSINNDPIKVSDNDSQFPFGHGTSIASIVGDNDQL